MKPTFDELWPRIKSALLHRALDAMDYADAEDLLSEYSLAVWRSCTEGARNFNNIDHASAYHQKIFKMRIIDYIRSRKRINDALNEVEYFHPRYSLTDPVSKMTIDEIISAGCSISIRHGECVRKMVEGYSHREIAIGIGTSAITVGRYLKDTMMRLSGDGRVLGDGQGGSPKPQTRKENEIMDELTLKKLDGVIRVLQGKTCVALVGVNAKGDTITSVEVRKGVKNTGVRKPVGEKAEAKKKEQKPVLQPKQGINLDNVKEFPASLDEWQKK